MKIKDLTPNDKNPRTITPAKLEQLKNAIEKFGDLSGVVFNRKSKQLVCGHQRIKTIEDADIVITKKYEKPTKVGTVREGYFIHNGEKFSYREVYWNPSVEKAANIAANKGAGDWDMVQLTEWIDELSAANFDLDLTMFDDIDRKIFETKEIKVKNTSQEVDLKGITKLQHECPKCGFSFNSGN